MKLLVQTAVVPVVKDAAWISETNASIKTSMGTEMTDYVTEVLADGLVILYAEDRGDTITYLHSSELSENRLEAKELRDLALRNLQRILPEIKSHNQNGVYLYTAGGTYEACLILFPWMWTKENCEIEGDVVFAIPTRDVLLVTGSKNISGIERMRKSIASIYSDNPNYKITGQLFTIRNEIISPYTSQ